MLVDQSVVSRLMYAHSDPQCRPITGRRGGEGDGGEEGERETGGRERDGGGEGKRERDRDEIEVVNENYKI